MRSVDRLIAREEHLYDLVVVVVRGEYQRRDVRRELTLLVRPKERVLLRAPTQLRPGDVVGMLDHHLRDVIDIIIIIIIISPRCVCACVCACVCPYVRTISFELNDQGIRHDGFLCTTITTVVARWCNAKAFGLAMGRSRVQILLEATLRNNLRQVVYSYVPLSPSSITWYQPKGGDVLRLGR